MNEMMAAESVSPFWIACLLPLRKKMGPIDDPRCVLGSRRRTRWGRGAVGRGGWCVLDVCGRAGRTPECRKRRSLTCAFSGAAYRNRTDDLFITSKDQAVHRGPR